MRNIFNERVYVIQHLSACLTVLFGLAAATEGEVELGRLDTGPQIQVAAELLYGYGYWGPFLLQFEDARLDCGTYDLVREKIEQAAAAVTTSFLKNL